MVGSGLASPSAVKRAAVASFGVAAVAGLALAIAVTPWLLLVGAVSFAAGWLYTGGPRPYGYYGLGELFVFVFFGLVATVGSSYVQVERFTWLAVGAAVPVGLLATALLVVNNLRDIQTDRAARKRTLAVVLGRERTIVEYAVLIMVAFSVPPALAGALGWPVLMPLLAVPLAWPLLRRVRSFTEPRELNPVLKGTARLALVHALLFAAGLTLAGVTS